MVKNSTTRLRFANILSNLWSKRRTTKRPNEDDAEQRVKTNLTLTAIADEENIEVSDEDIDKELEKMSEQFNISVEDIKSTLVIQILLKMMYAFKSY